MPMSKTFENRLLPVLDEIIDHYGTPFHIYDETGIRETGQNFIAAFSALNGFREYFAVKALPNPRIFQILILISSTSAADWVFPINPNKSRLISIQWLMKYPIFF